MIHVYDIPHDDHFHRKAPHSLLALPDGSLLNVMGGANRLPKDRLLLYRLAPGAKDWELIYEFFESQGPAGLYHAGDRVGLTSSLRSLPGSPEYSTVLSLQQQASFDNGLTWSDPTPIDTGHQWNHHGWPIVKLRDGTLVLPYHFYVRDLPAGTSSAEIKSQELTVCSLLVSTDHGNSWRPAPGQVGVPGGWPCEPTVVELSTGDLCMLMRTKLGYLYRSVSDDRGASWSDPVATKLQSPFTCGHLLRVSFTPNIVIVAWNNSPENRFPLDIAISRDDCESWSDPRTLANPGHTACYPKLSLMPDGFTALTWREYTNASEYIDAKAAVFDGAWLMTGM